VLCVTLRRGAYKALHIPMGIVSGREERRRDDRNEREGMGME